MRLVRAVDLVQQTGVVLGAFDRLCLSRLIVDQAGGYSRAADGLFEAVAPEGAAGGGVGRVADGEAEKADMISFIDGEISRVVLEKAAKLSDLSAEIELDDDK